ncbi:MAG: dimethyl sulfoxide reductase anchor subunit [Peptococcaceae bacterium]|nr:dimethyl sulfoxide reductase anchor subunit [Peptococcaceae bacterium]
MGEYPLILFTVLSQLSAGAAITLSLLDYFTKIDNSAGKKSTLVVLVMIALSLGISLLHLGHPFNAYRALTNIGSSWLSREAILFFLLGILLLVYYFQWKEENSFRKSLGLIISVVSVLAVVSSGMVYVLPAVPAWNNFSPILFFLFTGAALGPMFILLMLKLTNGAFSRLVQFTAVILAASLMCFIVYVSVLLSGSGASASTGSQIVGSGIFWPRLLVNWILPLGIFAWLTFKRISPDRKVVCSLFVMVFIGELLGRYLFYYASVALKVAGL